MRVAKLLPAVARERILLAGFRRWQGRENGALSDIRVNQGGLAGA
jgi:hypothetical protein